MFGPTFGPTGIQEALFRNLLGKCTIFRWSNPVAVLAMSKSILPTVAQVVNKATRAAKDPSFQAQTCQALFLPEDFWWFGGGIWCPLEILVKVWWSCRSFARAKADLKHNDQLVDTVRSFARDQSCFYFDSWHRQRCNLQSEKAGWTFAGNSGLSKTSYRIHWVIKPVPGTSGFSLKLQSHICISAEQCQTLSQGSVCKDMHHANFSAVSFAAAMCSLSSTGSLCFFLTWFFMCSNTK